MPFCNRNSKRRLAGLRYSEDGFRQPKVLFWGPHLTFAPLTPKRSIQKIAFQLAFQLSLAPSACLSCNLETRPAVLEKAVSPTGTRLVFNIPTKSYRKPSTPSPYTDKQDRINHQCQQMVLGTPLMLEDGTHHNSLYHPEKEDMHTHGQTPYIEKRKSPDLTKTPQTNLATQHMCQNQ